MWLRQRVDDLVVEKFEQLGPVLTRLTFKPRLRNIDVYSQPTTPAPKIVIDCGIESIRRIVSLSKTRGWLKSISAGDTDASPWR